MSNEYIDNTNVITNDTDNDTTTYDVISNPYDFNNPLVYSQYNNYISNKPRNRAIYYRSKEGLLELSSLSKSGKTDKEIARTIGVSYDTLRKWREKYPQINYVLSQTRDVVISMLENAALKSALGYTTTVLEPQVIKRDIVNADGKMIGKEEYVMYVKRQIHVEPEIQMIQFLLKNMAPDKYKGDAKAIAEALNDENIQKVLKMQGNMAAALAKIDTTQLVDKPTVIDND